ncbi:MAG: hypothetical protein U1D69_04315, partial [Polynucleobacter sp.]|nr:hypothetical protein [Polynucleobacter sp.]
MIVIYSGPEQYLTRTEYYLPEVLSAGLSAAKIESVGEKEPASQFAVAISNARSEPALASVSELQKDGLSSLVMDERSLRHVQFETQRTCVKNNRSEITASLTHIDNTLELFESAAIEYSKRVPMTVNYNSIMTDMERNFYEDAMNAMKSEDPDECIIEVTSVETMITPQAYIASAGPYNAWSAGFERTLFDAYQVVGFKLAPYISFDPYRSLQDYFLSLRAMLQNSILGATTVPYDQYILSEYFSDPVTPPNGSVNVPFTPMVASSLTTSVFLSIYMAAILVASIRRKILRLFNIILPTFEYKLAVFSSISIALVTAFIVAWLAFWLAQLI